MVSHQRARHYQIPTTHLWLEIYRLIGAVSAGRYVAEAELTSLGASALPEMIDYVDKSEASRLLVSIAAISRNLIDADAELAVSQLASWSAPVGSLVADLRKPDVFIDLDFRKACNKVIHATEVEFERRKATQTGRTYISDEVTLLGTKGALQWRAQVQILRFAECAAFIL